MRLSGLRSLLDPLPAEEPPVAAEMICTADRKAAIAFTSQLDFAKRFLRILSCRYAFFGPGVTTYLAEFYARDILATYSALQILRCALNSFAQRSFFAFTE